MAAGRRLSSDHVAITVHEALGTAAGDCDKTATVNLKPKRMGQTAVAALPGFSGLNSTYVAEHLLMWSPSPAGKEFTILVDAQCKRFLDNINKQARKAGGDAKARLDKIRADPKRCKRMIEMYRKAYAAWEGGSKPKSGVAFSVVTFMEETEASTAIEYVGEKQLMWEKQALTFWQSVDGGCLTEEEAQSRWSSMVANIEADRTVTDHKGPQKKPLRMAIGTRDIVANKNAFIKKRKMLCEEKGMKKASQALALLMLVLLPLLFLPVYT